MAKGRAQFLRGAERWLRSWHGEMLSRAIERRMGVQASHLALAIWKRILISSRSHGSDAALFLGALVAASLGAVTSARCWRRKRSDGHVKKP